MPTDVTIHPAPLNLKLRPDKNHREHEFKEGLPGNEVSFSGPAAQGKILKPTGYPSSPEASISETPDPSRAATVPDPKSAAIAASAAEYLEENTKAELRELASGWEVPGRSKMSSEELATAIATAEDEEEE